VNNWLNCHSSQSPFWSFSTPFYPWSVTSKGTYFNSLSFRCFHPRLIVESIKELGGVSNLLTIKCIFFTRKVKVPFLFHFLCMAIVVIIKAPISFALSFKFKFMMGKKKSFFHECNKNTCALPVWNNLLFGGGQDNGVQSIWEFFHLCQVNHYRDWPDICFYNKLNLLFLS